MGFTIAVPLSLEWLVGVAVDNLAHMLSAAARASPGYPRYYVESRQGANVVVIELPDAAYSHLEGLAKSNIVKEAMRRWYHLVDGLLIMNIGSRIARGQRLYLQDIVERCVSNRKDLEDSLRSVDVKLEPQKNKVSIVWGCREPFIPPSLIPYPLRTVEVLEGARTACPVQLEVAERKSKKGGRAEKEVKSGLAIELSIDVNVYAFISLALTVSTIHLELWPRGSRRPRRVRALIYRLTGYDAPKVLVRLLDGGWKLLRDLLGSGSEVGSVFSLDQERGLQAPEVLLVHFLLSSLSRYAELYNARLDLVSYKHDAGKRGDVDLLLSVHFSEYRPLMMLFARNPRLGERYRRVLVGIADKLRSRSEDEVRAARMGLEMVYLVDRLGREVATPFDLYALPRILESYRRSKYYAVFGESFRVFEDLIEEYLEVFG